MIDLNKALLSLAALAVAVLLYLGWRTEQRAIGKLEYAVKDDVTVIKKLDKRQDSIAVVYKTDTLRLTKQLTAHDTILTHLIDTAIVHHHDTVSVPVQVLVNAQDDIKACMVVKKTCEEGWASTKDEIVTLKAELGKVKRLEPSGWLPHFGVGGAAGVDVHGKPNAVVGLTLNWKLP